jgi:hypothetical protein
LSFAVRLEGGIYLGPQVLLARFRPPDGLQPFLELSVPLGGDLESGPRSAHNGDEVLVVGRCQMVELLVHALYVHLLTLLHQRSERRPQVLHHHRRIVPREVVSGLEGDIVQDKRTHYGVDGTHAEVVEVLGSCNRYSRILARSHFQFTYPDVWIS